MNEIFKILNTFNECYFYEKTHQYIYNKTSLTSSTTYLKRFYNEFNNDYWLPYSTLKLNHTVKANEAENKIIVDGVEYEINQAIEFFKIQDAMCDLQAKWKLKADLSTYKGSELHYFIECWYQNKIYKPNSTHPDYPNLSFKDIETDYKINQLQFYNFYKKTKSYLIPIKSELVIYDKDFLIGGMIDQLFYDTRINKFVIYDWKTNSKFSTSNYFNNLKAPFDFLDDCSLSKYSMQLNLYRFIFEKYTGIEMGIPQIILLDKNNDNYIQYQVFDLQKNLKKVLKVS